MFARQMESAPDSVLPADALNTGLTVSTHSWTWSKLQPRPPPPMVPHGFNWRSNNCKDTETSFAGAVSTTIKPQTSPMKHVLISSAMLSLCYLFALESEAHIESCIQSHQIGKLQTSMRVWSQSASLTLQCFTYNASLCIL